MIPRPRVKFMHEYMGLCHIRKEGLENKCTEYETIFLRKLS